MADTTLTITAASVIPSIAAQIRTGTVSAGVTVTAGHVLYAHTDGTLKLAVTTTALTAAVVGIALNGGGPGQIIRYVTEDPALAITTTAAMVVGAQVFLADALTAAGLMTQTIADINAGEFYTSLGTATSAAVLNFKITKSGVAHA
tara:strand:- start:260 stop:697 length:438 start_codon:yes stop_codon:yes gene_type:complete